MTGIFFPLVLLLTLTKTGQHSLPPYIYDHRNSRQGLLNSADGVLLIDPRNGEDGPPTNQVAHRTPFIPLLPH